MSDIVQAFRDIEKKNRQVDLSIVHVWPSVRKDHFKPIPDDPLGQF
jgi:hypothetical protein